MHCERSISRGCPASCHCFDTRSATGDTDRGDHQHNVLGIGGQSACVYVCVCVCLPPSPMATLPDIQWRCRTLTMHDLDEDLHTRETGAEEKKRFCWFSWMPLFFGFPWQRPSLEADSRCCSCLRCSIDRGVPRGTLLEIREPCLVQCPSPESGPAKVFRGRSANSPAI